MEVRRRVRSTQLQTPRLSPLLSLPSPPDPSSYRYDADERRPVEVLVFTMDPADVDDFLRIDHEVWLDESRPGEVTIVFVWPTMQDWVHVGQPAFQAQLQAVFDERFDRPYQLVREIHEERRRGLHRWSRFEPAPELG